MLFIGYIKIGPRRTCNFKANITIIYSPHALTCIDFIMILNPFVSILRNRN